MIDRYRQPGDRGITHLTSKWAPPPEPSIPEFSKTPEQIQKDKEEKYRSIIIDIVETTGNIFDAIQDTNIPSVKLCDYWEEYGGHFPDLGRVINWPDLVLKIRRARKEEKTLFD